MTLDCRYPGNDPAPGLDGSLPGDYGFDPIGFIADEESKRWYQQAELIHARYDTFTEILGPHNSHNMGLRLSCVRAVNSGYCISCQLLLSFRVGLRGFTIF